MQYHISLPNILYGHLMPPEDAYACSKSFFAVADGITRDPLKPKNLTGKTIEESLKHYPNPSGARFAANIFCETISEKHKTMTLQEAFTLANKRIARLNKKHIPKVDYLVNDYFACVAIAGVIKGRILHWGGLTDCGLIIYSKSGEKKFQTPDWMEPFHQFEKKEIIGKQGLTWQMPQRRKVVRRQYRNKPSQIIDGECVSYGALTGEKEAEHFFHFGTVKLTKGDLVVAYSDGFDHVVTHKDFFSKMYHKDESLVDQMFLPYALALAKKRANIYGRERTLIATII